VIEGASKCRLLAHFGRAESRRPMSEFGGKPENNCSD
jgi:hypothetical protein